MGVVRDGTYPRASFRITPKASSMDKYKGFPNPSADVHESVGRHLISVTKEGRFRTHFQLSRC